MNNICAAVCDCFKISPEELKRSGGNKTICAAKRVFVYLAKMAKFGHEQIANELGISNGGLTYIYSEAKNRHAEKDKNFMHMLKAVKKVMR
jgi:hypothetical protein